MIQIYIIRQYKTDFYKVGKTINIIKRFTQLQAGNPNRLQLVAISDGDIETKIHRKFKKHRVRGEWFVLNRQELEELLNYIANISYSKAVLEVKDKKEDGLDLVLKR